MEVFIWSKQALHYFSCKKDLTFFAISEPHGSPTGFFVCCLCAHSAMIDQEGLETLGKRERSAYQ